MKKYHLLLTPESITDIRESFMWNDEKSEGLGNRFLLSIEAGFSSILRYPLHYPKIYKNVHRYLIKRFPYAILYIIDKNTIAIISVIHLSRDPNYWKDKVN
jgi:toxin ParE1/3/4